MLRDVPVTHAHHAARLDEADQEDSSFHAQSQSPREAGDGKRRTDASVLVLTKQPAGECKRYAAVPSLSLAHSLLASTHQPSPQPQRQPSPAALATDFAADLAVVPKHTSASARPSASAIAHTSLLVRANSRTC